MDYISQGGAPHADEKLTAYRGGKALRRGWTTGSCTAAASQAAAVLLLTGIAPPEIHLHTPGSITFCLPVEDLHKPETELHTVRKDAGDDPDITNGVRITASVRRIEKGVTIEGGAGVGRITGPGLAMPVGEAAINPGPRQQIAGRGARAAQQNGYNGGFSVTISVEDGEALAARPTTGISASSAASLSSARAALSSRSAKRRSWTPSGELDNLRAGTAHCVPVPGFQRGARDALGLDLERAVKCSNFIGEAFDHAAYRGYPEILLVGHAGKLVKMAAGVMNTHSSVADWHEQFTAHAALCGARKTLEGLMAAISVDSVRGAAGRSESASARPVAHWQEDGNPHRPAHEGAGARGIHHVYRKIRRAGRVSGRTRTL